MNQRSRKRPGATEMRKTVIQENVPQGNEMISRLKAFIKCY